MNVENCLILKYFNNQCIEIVCLFQKQQLLAYETLHI